MDDFCEISLEREDWMKILGMLKEQQQRLTAQLKEIERTARKIAEDLGV